MSVLVVIVLLSIDSEKVTEIFSLIETELWLSIGEVEETVGAVVSIVKEFTNKVLLMLLALSVTLTEQSLYCPSLKAEPSRSFRLTVLLLLVADVVEHLQLPLQVMVPASVELKM